MHVEYFVSAVVISTALDYQEAEEAEEAERQFSTRHSPLEHFEVPTSMAKRGQRSQRYSRKLMALVVDAMFQRNWVPTHVWHNNHMPDY
jgi:hypothetical protein